VSYRSPCRLDDILLDIISILLAKGRQCRATTFQIPRAIFSLFEGTSPLHKYQHHFTNSITTITTFNIKIPRKALLLHFCE
jgi:hypothetical protein